MPKPSSVKEERDRIIMAARKFIKNGIKEVYTPMDSYPGTETISDVDNCLRFLPPALKLFLSLLFTGLEPSLKIASIGQAIIQASRPRAILAPLQIALGIELHHCCGSKFLVDSLNKLGFCSSYAEVMKFEKCAAVSHGYDIPIPSSDSSIHFVADNVDHDICTLDGRGTFHAMGIIADVTPSIKKIIVIPIHNVSIDDIKTAGKIRFQFYPGSSGRSSSIPYQKLPDFTMDDIGSRLDLLRNSLWFVKTDSPA